MNKTKKTGLKNRTRSIITLLLVAVLLFNTNIMKPKAADVSVSIALSSGSVSVGSGVTATISVSGGSISAYTMYVSYNSGVLQYNSGSGAIINGGGGTVVISGTSSGSITLSFTAIANGSSSIATSGSDFLNVDGNALSVSHAGVNVTVATAQAATTQAPATTNSNNENNSTASATTEGETQAQDTETTEEDTRSDNCNLSNLQISPGTLEPAFSPSTTSYQVQVDEDVTSMVVSATPEDDKATTQVWGAGLIEPGENTVKITVTAENGAVKVYNIRVLAGEDKGEANVTIDDEFYKFADNQNVDGIPDGFTDTTITYKDWEVLAFKSPNKKLTIVCLIDVEGELKWFVYDEEGDTFTPYQEFSSKYNRYIILSIPEDSEYLESFEITELNIDGVKVQALQSDILNDNSLYIVYAMNIEGDETYYVYDKSESTFMRYVAPEEEKEEVVATATDVATITDVQETAPTQPDSSRMLYVLLAVAFGLAFIFLVLFIAALAKCGNLKNRAQAAEDMVDSLGGDGVDSSRLNKKMADVKSASTFNLENLQKGDETKNPVEGKIELPRGKKMDKNTSFVDAVNSEKPMKFGEDVDEVTETYDTVEDVIKETGDSYQPDEIPSIDEIPGMDLDNAPEIGYVPDEKEKNFREYEDKSELINNKIMAGYDVSSDSAFENSADKIDDSENK